LHEIEVRVGGRGRVRLRPNRGSASLVHNVTPKNAKTRLSRQGCDAFLGILGFSS
jgi:hypothetical protein